VATGGAAGLRGGARQSAIQGGRRGRGAAGGGAGRRGLTWRRSCFWREMRWASKQPGDRAAEGGHQKGQATQGQQQRRQAGRGGQKHRWRMGGSEGAPVAPSSPSKAPTRSCQAWGQGEPPGRGATSSKLTASACKYSSTREARRSTQQGEAPTASSNRRGGRGAEQKKGGGRQNCRNKRRQAEKVQRCAYSPREYQRGPVPTEGAPARAGPGGGAHAHL
jgi:hypothetical protein